MRQVTAKDVQALRARSGAGMMDCKRALAESGGDIEAAVDVLRRRGVARAEARATRHAGEGLVALHRNAQGDAAMVEFNSETDFVARNALFQSLLRAAACEAARLQPASMDELLDATPEGQTSTLRESLAATVAAVGEHLAARRMACLKGGKGPVSFYLHNQAADGLGRIGALVRLETNPSPADTDAALKVGKALAMHVAAAAPLALAVDDLPPSLARRERAVLQEKARAQGKPEALLPRMVEGGMRKWHGEVALLEQVFVMDGKQKVRDWLKEQEAACGASLRVSAFRRFAVGEATVVTDGAVTDGTVIDGAVTDGTVTDGAVTDGTLTDGTTP